MNLKDNFAKIKQVELRRGKVVRLEKTKNKKLTRINMFFRIVKWHLLHPDYIFNKKFYFSNIELSVTTNCTLRCKGCAHYMYKYKPAPYTSSKEINEDLGKLLEGVKWIDEFRVLGGEPLLHPELHKIVEFLLKSEKIGRVEIVSNGTLLPSKELLNLFPNERLSLNISNYGKLSTKIDELCSYCNINVTVSDFDTNWYDHGDLKYNKKSEDELRKQYSKCYKDRCVMLNGKLFSCACSAYGSDLGIFKLEKDEYVDIHSSENINDLKIQLKNLKKRKHFTACSYCLWGTDLFLPIKSAEQLDKAGLK